MAHALQDAIVLAARLNAAGLSFRLEFNRPEALMFLVAVPGERWEIELFADGTTEVERFKSDGEIYDESVLSQLFRGSRDSAPE